MNPHYPRSNQGVKAAPMTCAWRGRYAGQDALGYTYRDADYGRRTDMAFSETDLEALAAAWNAHDADRVASYFTEDAKYEDVAMGMISQGKEQIKEFAG